MTASSMGIRQAEWSAEDLVSLPRLVEIARDLLRRQQDALIQGDVLRVERYHEAIAKILTTLRGHLARESSFEARTALDQLRQQMRTNRLLLENGLAVTDHFAASLAENPSMTSVLLSEKV
ncbi:hypothetical protein [Armatimonas sp.]|uniref:hypothetical protein n=1 Tax=Armatimonas sp. TaxID=1872638 RepID=UPI00286C353D|nr:hypothetical protein [Armatimonas sp.]